MVSLNKAGYSAAIQRTSNKPNQGIHRTAKPVTSFAKKPAKEAPGSAADDANVIFKREKQWLKKLNMWLKIQAVVGL